MHSKDLVDSIWKISPLHVDCYYISGADHSSCLYHQNIHKALYPLETCFPVGPDYTSGTMLQLSVFGFHDITSFSSFSEFRSLYLSALISGFGHLLAPVLKWSTFCSDCRVLYYLLFSWLYCHLQYQEPVLRHYLSVSSFKVSAGKHKSHWLWVLSGNFHLKATGWLCVYKSLSIQINSRRNSFLVLKYSVTNL